MMLLAALILLQSPAPPPRDASPSDSQTYTIRGRVTDAVTGQPIRGAEIGVSPAQRDMAAARGALTDSEGKWEVTGLPAGDYILSHSKRGYIRVRGVRIYSPVHVSSQHPVRDVALVLMRGGVITGRVVDSSGDVVPGVRVTALRLRDDQAWPVNQGDSTDDRGEFRLYGLEPGDYLVAANADRDRGFGAPATGISPVQTYYPAATRQADGERVTMTEQGEINDLTVHLQVARTFRVSGRAQTSGATARGGLVMLSEAGSQQGGRTTSGGMDPAGRFTIDRVLPGEYVAMVRAEMDDGDEEYGEARLVVDGEDVAIVVATRGPVSVSGRVVSSNGGAVPAKGMRAVAFWPDARSVPDGADAPVRPDGTFTVKTFGQRTKVRVMSVLSPAAWRVKDVVWRGQSAMKDGLDLSGGSASGVEVVIVGLTARLQGTVRDTAGKALAEGTVLIVPEDDDPETPGEIVRAVVTNAAYVSRPLAPGRYRAIAVVETRIEPASGDLIARIRTEGQTIEIGEHETATLSLTVTK